MRSFKRPNANPNLPPWQPAKGYVWARHKKAVDGFQVRKKPKLRGKAAVKAHKRQRQFLRNAPPIEKAS